MEPIATLMILLVSICLGLAGAAGMLEVVFVLMARPVAVDGRAFTGSQSIGGSR